MKKIIAIALLAALLLGLTACHGRTKIQSFDVPDEFDTEKTYEITFWAKNENNAAQRAVYAAAVAAFEELYPNIHVTLVNYTDYGDIYNDVIKNISTQTTPNVCITYPDHIATYLTGENVVVPLDSLMADKKYGLGGTELRFDGVSAEQIVPEFLAEGVIDGVQYAMPFMRSTEACYVNKTLLESLGFELPETLTWAFVWEVCEYAISLGKDENGNYLANGQSTFIPFIYKSTDNMMITMLRQLEADYSTDNGDILIFNDTTKALLAEVYDYASTGAFSTFSISGYPSNFLNAGQCIFAIDSTAGATWVGCDAPLIDIAEEDLVEFETAVMTVPQYDADDPQMISQGPSICIFNKEDAGEVLASWLFVQFLLTNQVQIAYAQTEGYVPVTTKAQESDEYQDYLNRAGEDNDTYYRVKIQAAQLLIANTSHTFVTSVFNGSTSLRNAAGAMIEDVTKAARRKKTVNEDYIDNLYDSMTSLYKLDQLESSSGLKKQDLGALPTESVILLAALGTIWVCIGTVWFFQRRKERKNR